MRKLLPVILGLFGLIAGIGAGYFLRPAGETSAVGHSEAVTKGHAAAPTANAGTAAEAPKPADAALHSTESAAEPAQSSEHSAEAAATGEHGAGEAASPTEFVKLNNQFVVPVIRSEGVTSLVILSLTLEVTTGGSEAVFAAEPKLRDSFLQVLFDYANANGFDGAFTQSSRMAQLRKALAEPARAVLGDTVKDVLIVDIVRQDT